MAYNEESMCKSGQHLIRTGIQGRCQDLLSEGFSVRKIGPGVAGVEDGERGHQPRSEYSF